jgi:hypothetical protein
VTAAPDSNRACPGSAGALGRPGAALSKSSSNWDRPGAAPGHLGQDRARRPAASPTIDGGMFMARVGIVTGAASGIGQALGTALVKRGDTVLLADVNADGAKQIAAGLGSHASAVGLDVRDADAVTQLVDDVVGEHGWLDLMFNNAGNRRRWGG